MLAWECLLFIGGLFYASVKAFSLVYELILRLLRKF